LGVPFEKIEKENDKLFADQSAKEVQKVGDVSSCDVGGNRNGAVEFNYQKTPKHKKTHPTKKQTTTKQKKKQHPTPPPKNDGLPTGGATTTQITGLAPRNHRGRTAKKGNRPARSEAMAWEETGAKEFRG